MNAEAKVAEHRVSDEPAGAEVTARVGSRHVSWGSPRHDHTPRGLPSPAGEPALRAVLDALTAGGHTNFGIDLRGVKLTATDIDWSWGDGSDVTGQAADLALALTGQDAPTRSSRRQPAAKRRWRGAQPARGAVGLLREALRVPSSRTLRTRGSSISAPAGTAADPHHLEAGP